MSLSFVGWRRARMLFTSEVTVRSVTHEMETRNLGSRRNSEASSGRPDRMISLFLGLVGVLLMYVGAALVVFDFSEIAYPVGEETHNGKWVAFGPRPRLFLCKPAYSSISYDGSEWPFFVFRPICTAWRSVKGYETPGEWRHE